MRPILKAYCLDCHGGGEKLEGEARPAAEAVRRAGGTAGPAIVAGKPEESYLLDRVRDGEMPPGEKKVPAEQIAIDRAVDRRGGRTRSGDEPEKLPPGIDITAEERAFWAFQPVRRPEPPAAEPGGSGYGPTPDRRVRAGRGFASAGWRSTPRPTGARSSAGPRST